MRTLSAATLAHYQQAVTTLAEGWRVIRTDSQVFGWTDFDEDIVIDGVTYRASEGLKATSAHTTQELNVDTLDVTAFLDVTTEAQIAAGIWDDADVVNFECRWDVLPTVLGTDVVFKRSGNLGRVQRQNLLFTAEIRGPADRLNTRIGRQYSALCPWRHAVWNGSTFVASTECQASLSGKIVSGTVTALPDDPTMLFHDATVSQADAYFNDGLIAFTSGANASITREIRFFGSQNFDLYRPLPFPLSIGDSYVAVRGDDHTFATCKDIYNNIVHFGGFPHVPGQDAIYATPTSF